MNAVITAGGTLDGEYAALAGTTIKALAHVRGRTMLDRAIEAAYEAGAVRVAVIGAIQVAQSCGARVDRVVDASGDGSENLLRALAAWPADEPLLFLTSDLPYVTGAAVRAFVERVPDGTFALALTTHDAFVRRFASSPPAGIRLSGERVVNGGAFVIPAGAAPRIACVARGFFDARKSPWQMARLLGPALILRYVVGRLSIGALERYASATLGLRACAVRDAPPELAFDADVIEEYRYACANA